MLVGQGVGWLVHVVRLGWDARGRGGFKGPLFPFRHTPELPDSKATQTREAPGDTHFFPSWACRCTSCSPSTAW